MSLSCWVNFFFFLCVIIIVLLSLFQISELPPTMNTLSK